MSTYRQLPLQKNRRVPACDSYSYVLFLDLYRILCVACQAASVIQKHWVEGDLAPDVEDDPVTRNQVIFRWVFAPKEPACCPRFKSDGHLVAMVRA